MMMAQVFILFQQLKIEILDITLAFGVVTGTKIFLQSLHGRLKF